MKKRRPPKKPRIPVIEDGRQQGQPIVGFKDDAVPPAHHATWRNSLRMPRWLRESLLPLGCVLVIVIAKAATQNGWTANEITYPVAGATISNKVTFNVSARSLAAPVTKIEILDNRKATNSTGQIVTNQVVVGTWRALNNPTNLFVY